MSIKKVLAGEVTIVIIDILLGVGTCYHQAVLVSVEPRKKTNITSQTSELFSREIHGKNTSLTVATGSAILNLVAGITSEKALSRCEPGPESYRSSIVGVQGTSCDDQDGCTAERNSS